MNSLLITKRAITLLLAMTLGILLTGRSALAQFQPSEYDLKSAFIYQFIAYVSWPQVKTGAPDAPLLIGVVGAAELADNLSTLALSRTAGTRSIEVRRLQPEDDPRDLHIVFVAADVQDESAGLLSTAVVNAVLTITETTPRSPDSIINFEIVEDRVRFDVALGLAQQHEMGISSRLLQVALRVVYGHEELRREPHLLAHLGHLEQLMCPAGVWQHHLSCVIWPDCAGARHES